MYFTLNDTKLESSSAMLMTIDRCKMINSALILLLGAFSLSAPASLAYRQLPKAQFQVLTPAGGSDTNTSTDTDSTPLQSMGVHLSPGLDRPRNAPVERYNPGEPKLHMDLVRWEAKKMPLMIWISPGLKLPDCPFDQIQEIRVDQVTQLLQGQGDPFAGLAAVNGWTPEVNDQVAAGIEQWRQFEGEGLFSFGFTDNPKKAHILIFFTDAFRDADAPSGIMVGGITSAQVYPYELSQRIKIAQKPVVIELATLVNNTDEKMQAATAHEFGHALGIKAHSPYREDIMYADRVVNYLSPADKATIRYLYHSIPKWVM